MIIRVRAKPRSKKEYVKEIEEGFYEVAVSETPEEGKANDRIIELMAIHFGVPKSKLRIIKGERSRLKLLSID